MRNWARDWELCKKATPGPWAEFIAEAREALPYWLNQMLDVVMSLCHEGVMTMSRAREILGVTLHEADKLYAEWLKTYIEGK